MEPFIPRMRRPVERENAQHYLLFTLLSFALTVSVTRLFLSLTGYPQIGNGTLHIAHVLWGGLLLFIAALIPILYANRWAYMVDAIVAGAGVGLFIDEVGKFITRTNDYFYPPAAPIIYAFFLLTVLLYLEFRRPHRLDDRAELYGVLEDMEELLDQDLSDRERARLLGRLQRIREQTTYPDFARLVDQLHDFINADTLFLVPHKPGLIERGQAWFGHVESRWIKRAEMRALLCILLLAAGIIELIYPMQILLHVYTPASIAIIVADLVETGLVHSQAALVWFEIWLILQAVIGVTMVLSAALYALRVDRRASAFASLGLLASLTTVNLLVFYFNQFSSILTAAAQFLLLMVVIYYRRHFVLSQFHLSGAAK